MSRPSYQGAAVLAGLVAVLSTTWHSAQAQEAISMRQFESRQKAELARAVLPSAATDRAGPGTLDQAISLPKGLEFTAGQDASEITIKTSIMLDGPQAGASEYFSFTAKAPLNKGGDSTVLGSLKGLGQGASVELKYTSARVFGVHTARVDASLEGRQRAYEKLAEICDAAEANFVKRHHDAPPKSAMDCPNLRFGSSDIEEYAPEHYPAYRALFIDPDAWVRLWGITGAVGTEKFDYLDPNTLAEMEVERTPWSAGAYVAWGGLNSRTLFTLKGEHKRVYKDADSEIRCPDPSAAVACVEGAIGPPKKETRDVVSFEVRRRFDNFGLAVNALYDVGDDTLAIDVPLYFVRDGAGGFTGGIRAGWDSESDDVEVGVFVSKAFSLFD